MVVPEIPDNFPTWKLNICHLVGGEEKQIRSSKKARRLELRGGARFAGHGLKHPIFG